MITQLNWVGIHFLNFFPHLFVVEKKSVKESPLKREVQAVKSILQGGSSSMRDHQTVHESQQHSKDTHRHAKDDKAKLKKRNLLEVFKKPSNAKEIGKPVKQRISPHVIDKFELECIEILKVITSTVWRICNFICYGNNMHLTCDNRRMQNTHFNRII